MIITSFFTNQGVPATGLTPTIRIWELATGGLVITDAPLSEVGGGVYKYDFAGFDPLVNYEFRADAGVGLNGDYDRYVYGSYDEGTIVPPGGGTAYFPIFERRTYRR